MCSKCSECCQRKRRPRKRRYARSTVSDDDDDSDDDEDDFSDSFSGIFHFVVDENACNNTIDMTLVFYELVKRVNVIFG